MPEEKLTAEMLQKILANPFYAINISPEVAIEHEALISEDTFVKVGVRAIAEDGDGGEKYLRALLENLKGNFAADDGVVSGFKIL